MEDLIESSTNKHTIYDVPDWMFMEWKQKYPFVVESSKIVYQYDQVTSRFTICCNPSATHHALKIYFQDILSVELQARLGTKKYLSSVQVNRRAGKNIHSCAINVPANSDRI